jgi:hypothetical protein
MSWRVLTVAGVPLECEQSLQLSIQVVKPFLCGSGQAVISLHLRYKSYGSKPSDSHQTTKVWQKPSAELSWHVQLISSACNSPKFTHPGQEVKACL